MSGRAPTRTPLRYGDPHALPPADVVVVTPYIGWPAAAGGLQRLLHTVRGISRGFRAVVVAQSGSDPAPEMVAGFCADSGCVGVVAVGEDDRFDWGDPSGVRTPGALVADLVRHRLPYDARKWTSATMRDTLAAVRRTTGAPAAWAFDHTVAEDARASGFASVLVDVDDIPTEIARAELRGLRWGRRRALRWADYLRLARWERGMPSRFTRVVVAKAADRRFFDAARPERVVVLPNGVRMPADVTGGEPGDARTLLFVGTLGYAPNEDALRFALDDVMPRVWSRRPDVRLQIVGRGCPDWLRARVAAEPRLVLAENVPTLLPYYRDAAVVIAPIRFGSGTRIKVLEALAYGKALVSTTFAAEASELIDGVHLVYADDPAAFAERAVALLESPGARVRLGDAGRAFVAARYDWDSIEATLPAIVRECLPSGARRAERRAPDSPAGVPRQEVAARPTR